MRKPLALAGLLCMTCMSSAWALEVPLIVDEPIGAARELEVVSGGIPFPEGQYKEASAFGLFDGGTEVPVQVSPIVKYPDGSLHWALVSFPVKLGANEKKTFMLKGGAGKAAPANPVTVKEVGSKVTLSNGLVSFTVDRENFNGFESVSYSGKEVFKAAKAGLTANGKGGPGKLTHFAYYYRGPVRTTLHMKGTYGGEAAPTWSMELTLCAGESRIRLEHNLRNGGVNAPNKLSISGPALNLGVAGELRADGSGTAGAVGGKVKSAAWGWQSFSGAADVLVFLRHGGPKTQGAYQAEVKDGELAVDLSGSGGSIDLEYGTHKITELDIVFAKSAEPAALTEPLHARAACSWYAANDGMGVGKFFGSLEDETALYKAWGWKNADDPKKMPSEKPAPDAYHCSFGDAHFETECDHLQGLVLGYLRTGQRGFLDDAHAWARPWRAFLGYRSDEWTYGKDGSYKSPKWGKARMCTEGCHTYFCGLFDYALITGNIDALEGAFDGAEFMNLSWYGEYSKMKPGEIFGSFGTRGFVRSYRPIVRAYDVARSPEWKKPFVHYVRMALETPDRDPRGFTCQGQRKSQVKRASGRVDKLGPGVSAVIEKEQVAIGGETLKHPKYGEWVPKEVAMWPEPIESWANNVVYQALSSSPEPQDQVMAEDAMDYAIAQAEFAAKYAYHPVQKATYYKMHLDFPIPDFVPLWVGDEWEQYQPTGTDSHYTKWWPNTLAIGYRLTGEPMLLERCKDVTWWGLNRDYIKAPFSPEGEAPKYARIENNIKGDWFSTTCLVFGLAAFPKKETEPPPAVRDLKAEPAGGGKVTLSWTAPGDEGGGKPARYQVKWSEKPMVDYLSPGDDYRSHFRDGQLDVTYWNMAANVAGESAPGAKGAKETMTVSVPGGKTLYFSVRTFDDSDNRSAMSDVVEAAVK